MSEKANTLAQIEARKKELEAEISQLRTQVGDSVGYIKADLKSKSTPIYWVKEYPLACVALAFGIGFLLGKGRDRNRKSSASKKRSQTTSSIIGDEIKRYVVRRITDEGKDWVEKFLESKRRQD